VAYKSIASLLLRVIDSNVVASSCSYTRECGCLSCLQSRALIACDYALRVVVPFLQADAGLIRSARWCLDTGKRLATRLHDDARLAAFASMERDAFKLQQEVSQPPAPPAATTGDVSVDAHVDAKGPSLEDEKRKLTSIAIAKYGRTFDRSAFPAPPSPFPASMTIVTTCEGLAAPPWAPQSGKLRVNKNQQRPSHGDGKGPGKHKRQFEKSGDRRLQDGEAVDAVTGMKVRRKDGWESLAPWKEIVSAGTAGNQPSNTSTDVTASELWYAVDLSAVDSSVTEDGQDEGGVTEE
jgi:hypothetical protein